MAALCAVIVAGLTIMYGVLRRHRAGPAPERDPRAAQGFCVPSGATGLPAARGGALAEAQAGFVQDVLTSGEEARLGGYICVVSLDFSDVAGFTRISERMPLDELVEYLGECLREMPAIVERHRGALDKFIGDGILALFDAPRVIEDHPLAACRAALDCQARLRVLRRHWARLGREPLHVRIGLYTGRAIVGNIGTPDRFEYTVTGDPVNLASQLEGLNTVYGTEIMASEDLRTETGSDLEWRTLDRVAVVGRTNRTLGCELLGKDGQVDPHRYCELETSTSLHWEPTSSASFSRPPARLGSPGQCVRLIGRLRCSRGGPARSFAIRRQPIGMARSTRHRIEGQSADCLPHRTGQTADDLPDVVLAANHRGHPSPGHQRDPVGRTIVSVGPAGQGARAQVTATRAPSSPTLST